MAVTPQFGSRQQAVHRESRYCLVRRTIRRARDAELQGQTERRASQEVAGIHSGRSRLSPIKNGAIARFSGATAMKSDPLADLYSGWKKTIADNPQISLEEIRNLFEHWGDVTGEPRCVDYLEVDAGGIEAMWAEPKKSANDRVLLCCHCRQHHFLTNPSPVRTDGANLSNARKLMIA
jgi:hypothetical protein